MFTTGKAFAAAHFAPDIRVRVSAAASSSFNGGALLGLFLGGVAIDAWGWRWAFFIVAPIALFGAVLALRLPHDEKRKAPPVDYGGTVLLTLTALLLLLGLQTLNRGSIWGGTSLLGGALLAGVGFFAVERRVPSPMLDTRLFSNQALVLGVSSFALVMATQTAVVFLLPFYLQDALGYAPTQVGQIMLVMPVMVAVGMPISSALLRGRIDGITARFGLGSPRARTTIGAFMLFLSMLGMVAATDQGSGIGIAIAVGGIGVGWQLFMPPNFNIMLAAVPPASIGAVNGIVVATTNIAVGVGVSAASLILTQSIRIFGGSALAADRSQWAVNRALILPAFRASWLLMAGFALTATFLCARRPRARAAGDAVYAPSAPSSDR